MNGSKAAEGGAYSDWRPSVNPWLITVSVMLATFMEVLDTTIVTVAVPHIAGSLSASNEEATWVLTSYLVSNAVVLPASGWLATYFGRRRFLIACIFIFTLSSVASGAAFSLGMLVAARVIQGVGGGALQPISQAILLESFPPEKRGMAMAAFAIGVVVAPIAGPTLGGWLTDNYSWRWAFYINIPVGVVAILMIQAFVEDPPYIREARSTKIDWTGFALMAVALGMLQIMLDKGQQDDWFAAAWIRWFAFTSAASMLLFIKWELRVKAPIVNPRVFRDRNFAVGTLLFTLVGVALYSAITLIPIFLQTLMGYPALQSGYVVSPRGIGALLMMPLVGYLTTKVDFRHLIGGGFFIVAVSLWLVSDLTLGIPMWHIAWPSVLTGVGLSMLFVPLATVSMGSLDRRDIGNASGVFNLMRNVGGSVGVSLMTTYLARRSQANHMMLAADLTPWNAAYQEKLRELQSSLGVHLSPSEALHKAEGIIYGSLLNQSQLLAFVESFRLLAAASLVCVGVAYLLRRVKPRGTVSTH